MRQARHRARGFTLIELMVAVGVVAILAAIAVSSYQTQVLHGRRSDALTSLNSLSQSLERCYAQNYVYTGCAAVPAGTSTSQNGYYKLTVALTASTYTLTGVPTGAQAKDKTCATFSLTNSAQTAQDTSGTDQTSTCWGSH